MARIARLVVPHYPHHITQRGNRRQQTFFAQEDYQSYINLLANFKKQYDIDIWAYCLMPNHVHIVAIPTDEKSLASCLSRTHRNYALKINQRNNWKGHLWQERFHSFVMDETHLISAVRYTEMNPVRAGLCDRPEDWLWSSTRSHLTGNNDCLVDVKPMLDRIGNWEKYLSCNDSLDKLKTIRKHTNTGRPAGHRKFLIELENLTGRKLIKQKPGPKEKLS